MAEVRLQQVGKTYPNGFRAVEGADFTVADREFMVLVGPSGCGKSTLLRMVAGLEEISEGEISIGGRVVNGLPPRERDVAMVFQNYALYPHMNVFDNMALGLKIRKEPRATIEAEVGKAASLLGIEALLERRPAQLSGGQRQRVAVGRAIVRRPQLFLFDEPLSNLDAKMRVEMRTEISKLHHRLQATMLYVTHDQVEAMTMGDRIVVMKDGQVQQIDTPLGLYNRPANRFVASFVGSPPMNFWEARLRLSGGAALVVGDQELAIEGALPRELEELGEGEWTFGLRPEDFRLQRPTGQAGPWTTVEAPVEVVEPLGSETMVYWPQAGANTVARVRAGASVAVGQLLPLHIDLGRAHFFDPTSGDAKLSWPGQEPLAE